MKKRIKYFLVGLLFAIGLNACTGMDETYKEFMGNSTVYIGKVDGATVYPGYKRALISWSKITDPRISSIKISWANGQKELIKEVASLSDTTVVVPNLDEGSYSFDITTLDGRGNNSMTVTVSGEVYGEFYRSTLVNRLVKNVKRNGDAVAIDFHVANSESFIKQEIYYYSSVEQDTIMRTIEKDELSIVLPNYDSEVFRLVSYYRPYEIEFDIFNSPSMIEYTPSSPYPLFPLNDINGTSVCPKFVWKSILGKEASPTTLYISDNDGATWQLHSIKGEEFTPDYALEGNTKYSWKISSEGVESDVRKFTTGVKDMYGNKEVMKLNSHTKGDNASTFIFIGEGFSQTEYKVNGLFDKAVKDAYETLFKVDPYKSYKEYFDVYKITAYSAEIGIDDKTTTVFETTANDSKTVLNCNKSKVDAYLDLIDGFSEADKKNTCVVVIVNANIDAGTTNYYNGGQTISLCPMFTNSQNIPFAEYRYLVVRHAGGFGYGLLGDENVNTQDAITDEKRAELKALWLQYRALNLDLIPIGDEGALDEIVRWKDFIGREGYGKVRTTYEGGYGYRKGVLRSEQSSALNESRIPYFNTASRVAIVQRILRTAGEEYTLDGFLSKDFTEISTDL